MNATMLDTFNRIHTTDYSVLTLDAHIHNGRPVVRTSGKGGLFDYVHNFRLVYPSSRSHPGYQILCQIHSELLLLEPSEITLLSKSPKQGKRLAARTSAQLPPVTATSLYLLNATPFMFYALQYYLPELRCLFCNNYIPIPAGFTPTAIDHDVLSNYRGPMLFRNVFPSIAFPCYNYNRRLRIDECPGFTAPKTTKIKPLEAAVTLAERLGCLRPLNRLRRIQAELAAVRNRRKP